MSIKAADVNKLRKHTGAGMMDCKKALVEAEGDFDKAIEILRAKGQKIAAKRGDRDAKEGVVVAKTNADKTFGVVAQLCCETDFVAKNQEFIDVTSKIATLALEAKATTKEDVLALDFDGISIEQKILEMVAKIGEKIELVSFETLEAGYLGEYTHGNYSFAVLVGLSKAGDFAELGKSLALQVAMMSPLAIDENGVDAEIVEKERQVGIEKAKEEGKPEAIAEKIAEGYVKKYLKEVSLLNQEYVDDSKITVAQFIAQTDKEVSVTGFKRVSLK